MQERIAQEMEGRRRALRIIGASAACVVALAAACSSPIADQTAAPKSSEPSPVSAVGDQMPNAVKQPVNVDQPYFEFQVEKQVSFVTGSAQPKYPAMLKSANVEGEVLAQFVVDTMGRADVSTFKVLKSTHDLFTQSVRAALPDMRFTPAEIGGQKVKQMVQQPFTFGISKPDVAGPVTIPNPTRSKK